MSLKLNNMFIKILNQLSTDTSDKIRLSSGFKSYLNDVMNVLLRTLSEHSLIIMENKKSSTITPGIVQAATRTTLPEVFVKYAIINLTKAVTRYEREGSKGSKTRRAHLVLSVPKVDAVFREYLTKNSDKVVRVSETSAVVATAVLEYICAEIIEMSIKECIKDKVHTIYTKHINMAASNDEEGIANLLCRLLLTNKLMEK